MIMPLVLGRLCRGVVGTVIAFAQSLSLSSYIAVISRWAGVSGGRIISI